MGTTQMVKEYHKTKDVTVLTNVRNYLINQWLMGNGIICGMGMTINNLSVYLGVDVDYIRLIMRDRLLSSKIWDKEKQEDLLRAMLGEQLAWALEDRMEISQQVEILKASQNGTYKPFITAELNKALKLKLDTQSGMQWTLKSIMGNNTTNIFNTFNQQNIQEETHNYISIEEARNMIIEANQQDNQNKTEDAKYLETHYDIESLPSVIANEQDAQLGNKEGLEMANLKRELDQVTNNYKGAMESASKDHHELRREIENNIDPNDEDPEMDIYFEDYEEDNNKGGSFASSFLIS